MFIDISNLGCSLEFSLNKNFNLKLDISCKATINRKLNEITFVEEFKFLS